jgi:hypothetical protein
MRVLERLIAGAALVAAGVAIYFALDARSQVKDARADTDAQTAVIADLETKVRSFKPTLVVQQRGGDPFEGSKIPADGSTHTVGIECADGAAVVGGGYAMTGDGLVESTGPYGGNGGPTPNDDAWNVEAFNGSGAGVKLSTAALCVRGEGGLSVRSTLDPSSRSKPYLP